jgi:peroxin-11B
MKLRADGRRFALSQAAARKENNEKSPEEKVRAEEERREKGRALLASVTLSLSNTKLTSTGRDRL